MSRLMVDMLTPPHFSASSGGIGESPARYLPVDKKDPFKRNTRDVGFVFHGKSITR